MSGESEKYILLSDLKVETVAWSIAGVYFKKTDVEIPRGELLIQKGDILCINGNESIGFKNDTETINIAPLFGMQYNLLKAIRTAKGRLPVFVTPGWMDWGAAVKKGDEVYIRVVKDGTEYCSTAVVHYIGTVTEDEPGKLFGVEITDSRYYGCGSSDGTFKGTKYFHCPDNNGLFLSLASVAKQPQWLKVEYRPNRDTSAVTEGMQKDCNIAPTAAKRNTKEPAQTSVRPNMEANRANVISNKLPNGTRVIIRTKDGRKIKGIVKWAGELPLEGQDPKIKIPVYGVETDVPVTYNQIEPTIAVKGRPQLGISSGHGRAFIPQTMVEQDEQLNGSDTTEKNILGTTVAHQEAGVDNEEIRQAASKLEKEKAALAKDLGPEIARGMDMEEQIKALEEFKKPKQCEDYAALNKGVQEGKEVVALNFEKEKAALVQHLGPEIARETDIEKQVKAMEEFKTAKQRGNNAALNKGMQSVGSSADSQYPAVQQYNMSPYSSNQLDRQQDPHQYPSGVGIGSAVIVSNFNPPVCGTVRWIGTIPQVNGLIAGVELEVPMDGCTDGMWLQNGIQYFDCPPNKGYFSMLEQLVPDQRFVASNNNPMNGVPLEVSTAGMADSTLFNAYIGDQRGIQGHQNSCYLDATLFGLFALSSSFDDLFLNDPKDKQSIEYIIWKKIVNPLRSHGAARYESVMALRERLEDLGKMKGITKDEKDPEEFLNMLFKHVLHPEPFIEIRRPYGVEGEFFVQLFLESEANSDAAPKISAMLDRMFTEQDLSFSNSPQRLLIQVPRFGKQFKTYKRVIPDKKLNVTKLVHTVDEGFCCWCDSPAAWECKDCTKDMDRATNTRICHICSERRHKKSMKYRGHNPVALPKRADVELDLLSVICIETSHYVCFTRANDKWLFFDSMANRIDDKYNIPRCTDCTRDINWWVYGEDSERLLSAEPKPELVRRFTQDVYMCVYVVPDVGLYM